MESADKPVVLIAEDEPIVRIATVACIEDAGFACLEAANAHEARDLITTHSDVAILFTDIEMGCPDDDGIILANDIHQVRPEIGVLVASGRICPAKDALPPQSIFLSKPYTPSAVKAALEKLIASTMSCVAEA